MQWHSKDMPNFLWFDIRTTGCFAEFSLVHPPLKSPKSGETGTVEKGGGGVA